MIPADKPDDIRSPRTGPLPILEGPWLADVWLIEQPVRHQVSGEKVCLVSSCDLPAGRAQGQKARETDVLCLAHVRRYAKSKSARDVQVFAVEQASAQPILAPRGATTRRTHFPAINFKMISDSLAEELRYLSSIKIRRNHWTNPKYVFQVIGSAVHYGAAKGLTSIVDFPSTGLASLEAADGKIAQNPFGASAYRSLELALPDMVKKLRAATVDPWESLVWHAAHLRLPSQGAGRKSNISWTGVTCGWLREGLMSLSKSRLQSGKLAWSTVGTYAGVGALLSRFFETETGPVEASELTRPLYLEFLAWVRDENTTTSNLRGVSTLARLLVEMREDNILPDLPVTVYLRRGENPVAKTRKPKPFPGDILERIDRLIADKDVDFPSGVRLLLRLFRSSGPRAAEALTLTPDSISYVEGRGYTLEYFQTKTQELRRVPLPEKLGADLVEQSMAVREKFGQACELLFPYNGPGAAKNVLLDGAESVSPWPYASFTSTVWAIYRTNGIVRSELTGEVLTGAQVHRFRHTIATGLLNEGWSQYEVQTFLGHKSPSMMQAYAEIHDDTLRDKYVDFLENAVDSTGARALMEANVLEVERLRDRITRSTLADGYCTLPEKLNCDFIPSPCLSCSFFRTTPTFLPIHIRRRDESLREIDLAKDEGRARAAQAHEQTVEKLDVIISALQKEPTNFGEERLSG
jgi:integrase